VQDVISNMYDTEVRGAAVFALGCLIDTGLHRNLADETDEQANERIARERDMLSIVHNVANDGSMLVRVECAIAIARAAVTPTSLTSKKKHNILIAQAFDSQRERVMFEYSAHRIMMVYQPGMIAESPTSSVHTSASKVSCGHHTVPRAPASEGLPSSLRLTGDIGDSSVHSMTSRDGRRQAPGGGGRLGSGRSHPVSRALSGVPSSPVLAGTSNIAMLHQALRHRVTRILAAGSAFSTCMKGG
jgi:hypothetical protein